LLDKFDMFDTMTLGRLSFGWFTSAGLTSLSSFLFLFVFHDVAIFREDNRQVDGGMVDDSFRRSRENGKILSTESR
jgi:hypothetical protein